jgi:cytochrome b
VIEAVMVGTMVVWAMFVIVWVTVSGGILRQEHASDVFSAGDSPVAVIEAEEET